MWHLPLISNPIDANAEFVATVYQFCAVSSIASPLNECREFHVAFAVEHLRVPMISRTQLHMVKCELISHYSDVRSNDVELLAAMHPSRKAAVWMLLEEIKFENEKLIFELRMKRVNWQGKVKLTVPNIRHVQGKSRSNSCKQLSHLDTNFESPARLTDRSKAANVALRSMEDTRVHAYGHVAAHLAKSVSHFSALQSCNKKFNSQNSFFYQVGNLRIAWERNQKETAVRNIRTYGLNLSLCWLWDGSKN